jgi:hypothetical protein
VTSAGLAASWYGAFRIAVFALLACNTAYYLYAESLAKGLDAAGWLVLLVLYALETELPGSLRARHATFAVRAARLAAAVAVCAAGVGYIILQDTLDAINAALWIAVVVLLEIEVRRPEDVARHRTGFTAAAAALYAGLAVLVAAWAWRGAWLDAYDALLWLIAFATIEMDVLGVTRQNAAA